MHRFLLKHYWYIFLRLVFPADRKFTRFLTWHAWCQFKLQCRIDNIQRLIKSKVLKLLFQNIMEKISCQSLHKLRVARKFFWYIPVLIFQPHPPCPIDFCVVISRRDENYLFVGFLQCMIKKKIVIFFSNHFLKSLYFFLLETIGIGV